jgi:hypothetical protein
MVAAIAPAASQPSSSPQETVKLFHSELRRDGCLSAAVDGDWNAASQRSLSNFNEYAGTKFDAKLASFDALDTSKPSPDGSVRLSVTEASERMATSA